MAKESKPKAPKAPAPTDALVLQALKKAATKPGTNWTAASAAGLFNTKEANHLAAIEECTKGERPLLRHAGKTGVLTAAGFARVAGELSDAEATEVYERLAGEVSEEQIGALARAAAGRIALERRADFILAAIRRTPVAAAELNPLLAEVNAAARAESEAKKVAALKEKQAHDAAVRALEETKRLLEEGLQIKRDALRHQWDALGGDPAELRDIGLSPQSKAAAAPVGDAPEPQTDEEKDFRRYTADRLAAAWRDAWNDGKTEGRDYMETAIWNLRGMKMIGEAGLEVAFDGRLHESEQSVFTNAPVRVVRPGWLLKVDDEDYVALKAAVEKA
ncbi:MAG TPA: hypothetical protein VGE74_05200 [Gemmata sp.]